MTDPTSGSFTKPESRTVSSCMSLREDCQGKIFKKMDGLHDEQMKAIGEVKSQVAFINGKMSVTDSDSKDKNGKRDWGDVAIRMLIAWGPWIALMLILGLIQLLRGEGGL